jgi:hypothetical protein
MYRPSEVTTNTHAFNVGTIEDLIRFTSLGAYAFETGVQPVISIDSDMLSLQYDRFFPANLNSNWRLFKTEHKNHDAYQAWEGGKLSKLVAFLKEN